MAALLAPQPDPKLLITDGREKTDGFGTTGQAPSTLVQWKHEPRNALFYKASCEGLPYSGAAPTSGRGCAACMRDQLRPAAPACMPACMPGSGRRRRC